MGAWDGGDDAGHVRYTATHWGQVWTAPLDSADEGMWMPRRRTHSTLCSDLPWSQICGAGDEMPLSHAADSMVPWINASVRCAVSEWESVAIMSQCEATTCLSTSYTASS